MERKYRYITVVTVVVFMCCVIIRGSIPSTTYYTYHFDYYKEIMWYYLSNLLCFIYVYIFSSCVILRICNINQLIKIFIIIQPVKLIMDLMSGMLYEKWEVQLFQPCSHILFTIVLVCVANLFILDKSELKQNSHNNYKVFLKSIIVCILTDIIARLVSAILALIISSLYSSYNSDKFIQISTICMMIELAVNILSLVIGGVLLFIVFRKRSVESRTNKVGMVLLLLSTVAMVFSTSLFLSNGANPIMYYLSYTR